MITNWVKLLHRTKKNQILDTRLTYCRAANKSETKIDALAKDFEISKHKSAKNDIYIYILSLYFVKPTKFNH